VKRGKARKKVKNYLNALERFLDGGFGILVETNAVVLTA
jgi:hypothetical protein